MKKTRIRDLFLVAMAALSLSFMTAWAVENVGLPEWINHALMLGTSFCTAVAGACCVLLWAYPNWTTPRSGPRGLTVGRVLDLIKFGTSEYCPSPEEHPEWYEQKRYRELAGLAKQLEVLAQVIHDAETEAESAPEPVRGKGKT